MQRIFIKKCFLFMLESVCRVKRFHLSGKRFCVDEEVETKIRKVADTTVKNTFTLRISTRCDKCINVGGGYIEK
jgi:hypothetical protein